MKLPARHCPLTFLPSRLDSKTWKVGVSLAAPSTPKGGLQSLPTTLRIQALKPISSCSKAPGVFSSRCRYPASSRESHFHRAHPRDSSPVVTPFVRSGTYPERNCATLERFTCVIAPLPWSFSRSPVRSDYIIPTYCGIRRIVSEDSIYESR